MPGIRFCTLIAALFLTGPVGAAQKPAEPTVAGYVFVQDAALKPGQIDAASLTRINYAFANIKDGRMVTGYASDQANFAYLTGLRKQNPALTVLVSVGGWLWSTNFSDMALTPRARSRFIQSVMDFLARYDLDGLDIDWEYPGLEGSSTHFRGQDGRNFTLLLKELRKRFDQQGAQTHRRLFLTIAAGSSQEYLDHTEMRKDQEYVDTVNLMAYDYVEPGSDPLTGHHAPLFTNPADPRNYSADASVRAFEKAGVPGAKILLGMPFYGHVWGQVADRDHGFLQPGKPVPHAFAPYAAIAADMLGKGFVRYWDAVASAPYLYNPEKQMFVSYDDPESVAAKCRYVLDRKLGGVMFWEYSGDPAGVLLGVINQTLRPGVAVGRPAP
ncbi:MAG: glycoside hydrolase family 18 protein [Terracidiphilus sp.]|nr:glycoside hydrolase family 18 protein [Terracidiphilus sp.]